MNFGKDDDGYLIGRQEFEKPAFSIEFVPSEPKQIISTPEEKVPYSIMINGKEHTKMLFDLNGVFSEADKFGDRVFETKQEMHSKALEYNWLVRFELIKV